MVELAADWRTKCSVTRALSSAGDSAPFPALFPFSFSDIAVLLDRSPAFGRVTELAPMLASEYVFGSQVARPVQLGAALFMIGHHMAPTVLLVHGAFADGSAWNGVLSKLTGAGVPARAVANPLRGLTLDGEYVKSVVSQIDGDVVLVGHSYGGSVISYAGSTAENVKALVFVGAFGLDQGENAQNATADFPEVPLGPALQPWTYPGSELPEFTLQVDQYRNVFAADLPEWQSALGAQTQRPVSALALGEPLAVTPAWKRLPSWWVAGTADNAIHPEYQKATAGKIGADLTMLEGGSHSIAVSRPAEVAEVILKAVHAAS
ncbi:alpha/beta fold hydrolase [Curtobacterium flaccumfaciens pv. flaccumfaciens]|uniref:alpha/beta fold hydrolase n=1 Tax=Curtobacterium flaccumfaciens TaxID=2035 RepID=UPI003A4DFF0F